MIGCRKPYPSAWWAIIAVTLEGGTAEPSVKKTTQLKRMIQGPDLEFLMEAHNGLSAKFVEEAKFRGIWASGLAMSASFGVRDSNEASWTQVLDMLEFMADATDIPILHDGDTGYGNFNTMRRVVRKLEQRGVAGICVEDKIFPKTNSFIRGMAQPLADMEEFAGKIKAGKDAQHCDDFVIVARVEAFIAGWGLEEALRRAEAYRVAGADAVLIHSALRNPSEVLAFKQEWGNRLPVIIIPTKYYATPTEVFRQQGFSMVIWANHLMRSSLQAMRHTAQRIHKDQSLINVEDTIAPIPEVFRLQGEDELEQAEKIYLPHTGKNMRAVILAAARGHELGALTADRPKCMVEVAGRPLLHHITETHRSVGVRDMVVVRGYCKEAVSMAGVRFVDNNEHGCTGEVHSLHQARDAFTESGGCVVSYGDVLCRKYILEQLVEQEADLVVAVDANWKDSRNQGRHADYVSCSEPCSRTASCQSVTLCGFVPDRQEGVIHGEWMGFFKMSARGAAVVAQLLASLDDARRRVMKMSELITLLIEQGHKVHVVYTAGHWLDIDSVEDLVLASAFVTGGSVPPPVSSIPPRSARTLEKVP